MGLHPFSNLPLLDFTQTEEVQRMKDAVGSVEKRLGHRYTLFIGGQEVSSDQYALSINPARPDQVVGEFALGTVSHVDRAVAAAKEAFLQWSRVPLWDRVALLLRAGHILRERRREFVAWQAFEVGKNFSQSDGEVAEGIDHFELTARMVQEWMAGRPIQPLASEFNEYRYRPLGVGTIIAPWNFPTTLPLGMILGAVATGNTVVFKPAEQSTVVANQLVRVLQDAGLPPGVLNLVSGEGEVLGPRLATHPDIRFVSFVGSRAVGTALYHQASATAPGQHGLRRIMTEMGGKNATVVADDADLEWAVDEVALAAFGFQGQKCSATSRAIIMESVYPNFVEGIVHRAEQWAAAVGLPTENALFGPVIEESALNWIMGYIEQAPRWGNVRTGGRRMDRQGFFVQPTIVAGVDPDTPIFQDEIFGPVLALTSAKTYEEAIALANHSEYALTGAVFSRSPQRLATAREQFYVGNLYLNRSSTGAMAGVHPFGGFRFSGTGPKVGSPDYLGFFLESQVITEKVQY